MIIESNNSEVDFYKCKLEARKRFQNPDRKLTPLHPSLEVEEVFKNDNVEKTVILKPTLEHTELWYTISAYLCMIHNIPVNGGWVIKRYDVRQYDNTEYVIEKPKYRDSTTQSVTKLEIQNLHPAIIFHKLDSFGESNKGPFDFTRLFKAVYHDLMSADRLGIKSNFILGIWLNMAASVLFSHKFYDTDPMPHIDSCKLLIKDILYQEADEDCIFYNFSNSWHLNNGEPNKCIVKLKDQVDKLREIVPSVLYTITNIDMFIYISTSKYIEINSYASFIVRSKGFKNMNY